MIQSHQIYAAAKGLAGYEKPITLYEAGPISPSIELLVQAINMARLHGYARICWESPVMNYSDQQDTEPEKKLYRFVTKVLRSHWLSGGELICHHLSQAPAEGTQTDGHVLFEIICRDHPVGKERPPSKDDVP